MHYQSGLLVLLFVIGALFVGAVTRYVLKNSRIPYTVALLLVGMVFGGVDRVLGHEHAIPLLSQIVDLVADVDPHLILFVLLPTLIFESAYAQEVHLFRRIFRQISILAVPGLILSTLLTAVFIRFLFPWDWSWSLCLMFGALISATDPVAVVALLKEVSSRKRLETLIEGESLLNDGTAIVLFTLFLGVVTQSYAGESADISLVGMIGSFVWVVSMGVVVGLGIGWLALQWIGRIFNDSALEIAISIVSAYLAFFIAEALFHVSGVVAVVSLALLFAGQGRTRISPEVSEFVHHFWETMAYIANTLIFLLVGILIASRLEVASNVMWFYAIVLYLGLLVIRAVSVGVFMPVLKRVDIGITREKAMVLIWGGLRGAVALALALSVAHSDVIPQEIRDQILFLCAGIVVLTIVINGSSMGWLLGWLGLNTLPPAKQATVDKAQARIRRTLANMVPELERNSFLKGADWPKIREAFGIGADESLQTNGKNDHSESTTIDEHDLSVAFRRQLLEAERNYYWIQYREGLLGRQATRRLVEAVEHALDGEPRISPRPELHKIWRIPALVRVLNGLPMFDRMALAMSFRRMTLGYDIARGFISAQNEISQYIESLSPSSAEATDVRKAIQDNKEDTFTWVAELVQSFPEVVSILETNAANRLLLIKERLVIYDLVEHGVLDQPEANKLIAQVEASMVGMQRAGTQLNVMNPAAILAQQSWAQNLPRGTFECLVHQATHHFVPAGEIIIHQGEHITHVSIIVRGNAEQCRLIPEDDAPAAFESGVAGFGQRVLLPGDMIGGVGLLTGVAEYSVITRSPLDVIRLPVDELKELMNEDRELQKALIDHVMVLDGG